MQGPVPWGRIIPALEAFLEREAPWVTRMARERRDPFRVLVSTVISARTKDEVTEEASLRLLARAPNPEALAALQEAEIAGLIYPAGFYRTKAAHLRALAGRLLDGHAGRVPSSLEELVALPGVGRKTANLVRTLGFGLEGICVDTHVHRIANRLGWVRTATPERTEAALREALPRRYWIGINTLLVAFGRRVCTPLSPRCSRCPILEDCPRVGVGRTR